MKYFFINENIKTKLSSENKSKSVFFIGFESIFSYK